MPKHAALGLDGCRAGWVLARFDAEPELELISDLQELKGKKADQIWIDVPIGLSEYGYRDCDLELRSALGRRASSVFFAPIRKAVYADSYREACTQSHDVMGKKISVQAWNICGKIREVDAFLQLNPDYQSLMFESHPEWAFVRLNKGKPLTHKKKEAAGFIERLEILESYHPKLTSAVEEFLGRHPRKKVLPDDVLDALVLAVHAKRSQVTEVHSFPSPVPVDATGLKMAIYFT